MIKDIKGFKNEFQREPRKINQSDLPNIALQSKEKQERMEKGHKLAEKMTEKRFEAIEKGQPEPLYVQLSSEGRQVFTRWKWSWPNQLSIRSKTFCIKYEKSLSTAEKLLLSSFQKKCLYHAMDDILYSLQSKPIERDNLLELLYSPVLSLQNNLPVDFSDIWIDEISIHKIFKKNKFLSTSKSDVESFRYINITLLYNKKSLPKKTESLW